MKELHLLPTLETHVFVNQRACVVIKQEDLLGEEVFVMLDKNQAKKVAEYIIKLINSGELDA